MSNPKTPPNDQDKSERAYLTRPTERGNTVGLPLVMGLVAVACATSLAGLATLEKHHLHNKGLQRLKALAPDQKQAIQDWAILTEEMMRLPKHDRQRAISDFISKLPRDQLHELRGAMNMTNIAAGDLAPDAAKLSAEWTKATLNLATNLSHINTLDPKEVPSLIYGVFDTSPEQMKQAMDDLRSMGLGGITNNFTTSPPAGTHAAQVTNAAGKIER